ncbi:hypothetical protein RUM43_011517 [Polyplax serrata]|uniref:Uncharacterized protein n=1 Tax=Polyplax serrata TaxID=468196 RepID=A0AAN8S7W9_POLSC
MWERLILRYKSAKTTSEFEENEVRRANGKPKQKNSQEKTKGVRLLMLETKDLVEEEEGRRDSSRYRSIQMGRKKV